MKKSNLPKNWIVCSSKSYPDKVYYFNKMTNKASWELPVAETENKPTPKKGNARKRKKETDSELSRPKTPEMHQETERPVLQAKRRISLILPKADTETPQMREIRERLLQKQVKLNKGLKPSTSAKQDIPNDQSTSKASVSKISVAKGSETKVSSTTMTETKMPEVATTKQETNVPENIVTPSIKAKRRYSQPAKTLPRRPGQRQSTAGSDSSAKEEAPLFASPASSTEQNLTPQMRLLYAKIEEKKVLKTGSPRKSLVSSAQSPSSSSTTSSSTSGSTSGFSSRSASVSTSAPSSQTSVKSRRSKEPLVPIQETQNTVTTRRRSRLSSSSPGAASADSIVSNLSALPEEKEPEETQPKETQPEKRPILTPSSTRKSRRTILIEPEKAEPDASFKISSPHPTTSYPKNIAKRRLDDLRRSLSLEKESKESQVTQKRMSLGINQVTRQNESEIKKMMRDPGPEPSIYTNAATRAKNVRCRVLNYQSCTANVNKTLHQSDLDAEVIENQPILSRLKDFNNDPYYEEMEWEPIEDEKIMTEVQAVRTQLYTRSINPTNIIQENVLELPSEPVRNKEEALYIVVDTNVFLSNLQAVEEARDAVFKSFGRPFIVIPWTVLQELDFIKDDKSATRSETLKAKARRAVRFVHQHFSTKHPRVLGQTPDDVASNKEIFATDCPDDEILQSCLQIRNAGRSVVLLSYDKNLCNKAMIHDIVTVGRDDPFEKIDYLNINDLRNDSVSVNHLSFNQKNPENIKATLEEELLIAEDIFEETKAVLLKLVSPVVAKEMQNLFGDSWERYTIIRPPWSTKDVLKCAVKHWMAAVSESFTRRAESILKELLETISNPPTCGRRLKDVSYVIERCIDLMQTLNQQKYPELLDKTASAMNALKQRCLEETRKICQKRIRDEIGHEDNIARQDCRAEIALNSFNKVYAFTRDFYGTAAEALHMTCPIPFEKTNERFTANFVNSYQPVLAAKLNHLLQILSLALEDINGLRPDHRSIIVLTEALTTFLPEEFNEPNVEVTSLDLYCLIKNKEDVMKRGLAQLQDLSKEFCRMATFRCR